VVYEHRELYSSSQKARVKSRAKTTRQGCGHSRLVYRDQSQKRIEKVMEGNMLTPQRVAQLKNLSSNIRVECHRGTVKVGQNKNQIVCEGIVLKTAKSQAKIVMELLAMLLETLLGDHYQIIPKSLGHLLEYELYGQIVNHSFGTIEFCCAAALELT
jgi:hypothetical protein